MRISLLLMKALLIGMALIPLGSCRSAARRPATGNNGGQEQKAGLIPGGRARPMQGKAAPPLVTAAESVSLQNG